MPTIPFGKYRGQPYETLLIDVRYTAWLKQQDWFRNRFPEIFKFVKHHSHSLDDSPAHNEMQLRWLNKDYLNRLLIADLCGLDLINDETCDEDIKEIQNVIPEKDGWDIYFRWVEAKEVSHYFVELKPTIGDDYPSILRSIDARRKLNTNSGQVYLVAGQITAITADAEVLFDYFERADVLFYTESELKIK